MATALQARVVDPLAAHVQALGPIAGRARREACVMAFGDAFWIVGMRLPSASPPSPC